MRWEEASLWAVPVIALAIWWFGPRHFSRRAVTIAALLLCAYAYLLYYVGQHRVVHGPYLPARVIGGHIVGGP